MGCNGDPGRPGGRLRGPLRVHACRRVDAPSIPRREPGENSNARLALDLADAVALGALCPAARTCVGCRSRSLLAESPWALAELGSHRGGASLRVGLARLPVAFGLRRRSAY